jgi:hypothetical protein
MAIKIDISQVPAERQHRSDFKERFRKLQDAFADRQYGYRVCLHEAAHAILMEQEGIANVRFSGPGIKYDYLNDLLSPEGARVTGDDSPLQPLTEAWLLKKAMQMAAGGVALRKYEGTPDQDCGDGTDYEQFLRIYLIAPAESRIETPESFWKRAQEAASVRLDEADTKTKVLAKADEYLRLLYPNP